MGKFKKSIWVAAISAALSFSAHADSVVQGSIDIISDGRPIAISSSSSPITPDRAYIHIINQDFQFGLRATCHWTGTQSAPYNNNDCSLFEIRNSAASNSHNRSWAVSAANAYNSIPVGVTDTGDRVGVYGWATSVNAHGLTHAGTLQEQNGVRGMAGFQGDGEFLSPSSARINMAVGVKGLIASDSATILDARAGEFLSHSGPGTIKNNYAVYASAYGGTDSNWSFYGAQGRFYNGNKSFFGRTVSQSATAMASRMEGNSFEFGHWDLNGYASTIGSTYIHGYPFLAFSAEADQSGNTFTTRGKPGSIISGDLAGGIVFSRLPSPSASGQSMVESARFNTRGNLVLSKNPPISSVQACSSGEVAWDEGHIYICTTPNTWKRTALSGW